MPKTRLAPAFRRFDLRNEFLALRRSEGVAAPWRRQLPAGKGTVDDLDLRDAVVEADSAQNHDEAGKQAGDHDRKHAA